MAPSLGTPPGRMLKLAVAVVGLFAICSQCAAAEKPARRQWEEREQASRGLSGTVSFDSPHSAHAHELEWLDEGKEKLVDAYSHAQYGPNGFVGFDDPRLQDMDSWKALFEHYPFFSVPPKILSSKRCPQGVDAPVSSGCSPLPLLTGHYNPTLQKIPDDSGLIEAGQYIAIARRAGPTAHEWFGGSQVFRPPQREEGMEAAGPVRPTVMLLGKNMEVIALAMLYDPMHPHGWIDMRLFILGGEWWAHFRAPYIHQGHTRFRAVIAQMHLTAMRVPGYTSLTATLDHETFIPMDGHVAGKNHMFFQDGEEEFSLIMLNPVVIHRVRRGNLTVEPEVAYANPRNEYLPNVKGLHLNGGRLLYLPESDEYLGMAHHLYSNVQEPRQPNYLRRYTNLFFTLEGRAPYALSRMSPELCFESFTKNGDCEMIQFAAGFTVDPTNTTLLIPIGINRLESKVFSLPVTDAAGMLRPVSELGEEAEKWGMEPYKDYGPVALEPEHRFVADHVPPPAGAGVSYHD